MEYKPAYIITNEDLRWSTTAIDGIHRVLTVTGSGDQALFYKLAGASVVDTFDITNYAGLIQDIKYNAIKRMDRDAYIDTLEQLCRHVPIMNIPQIQELAPYLTEPSQSTIAKGALLPLLNNLYELQETYKDNMLHDDEYGRLKQILDKPFRFVQSDIQCVGSKISDKYDLINISNILDYGEYRPKSKEIIRHVGKLLRVDGYIADCAQSRLAPVTDLEPDNKNDIEIKYREKLESKSGRKIFLYQRTR